MRPHQVLPSDCAEVGRMLRRHGWKHLIDPALFAIDFGVWEVRRWTDLPRTEIDV